MPLRTRGTRRTGVAATTPESRYVAWLTMMSPRPPPPAIAAIVAVAITKTAAIRMPAKISGSASGSSTRSRICCSRHPHPPRRLDDVPVDAFDREIRVREDRRDGEDDQAPRRCPRRSRSKTSRKNAIRTRLGSARPMFEMLIATNEPRWKWPRITPSGQRDRERDPERGSGEPELLERLVPEQARMVADEADRVREGAPAEGVGEDHALLQGVITRWASDQDRVGGQREQDRERRRRR